MTRVEGSGIGSMGHSDPSATQDQTPVAGSSPPVMKALNEVGPAGVEFRVPTTPSVAPLAGSSARSPDFWINSRRSVDGSSIFMKGKKVLGRRLIEASPPGRSGTVSENCSTVDLVNPRLSSSVN
jgi:hypothetical protein